MMPLSPYLEMFAEHLKYVEVTLDSEPSSTIYSILKSKII